MIHCRAINNYLSACTKTTCSLAPFSSHANAAATSSTRRLSSNHESVSPLLPSRKRRRRTSNVSDPSDPVVGQITASGKFKCFVDAACSDLSFGRQADFRRHYEHHHAPRKVVYYCPVSGCSRSNGGGTGKKGKSFGTREDKMKEHVRTVHEKKGKKMKVEVDFEDEEEGSEEYYEE
jgi:hypothetical protein